MMVGLVGSKIVTNHAKSVYVSRATRSLIDKACTYLNSFVDNLARMLQLDAEIVTR